MEGTCVKGTAEEWLEMEDIACGNYLYSQCKLTGLSSSENANWCISAIDNGSHGDPLCPTYPVYTMEGTFHHQLEFFIWNGRVAVLHLTFVQARNYPETMILYRTPEAMWFYLNHNWRSSKEEPIYLTTEVGLVLANPEKAVFWIQKIEWIGSLDCEFFRGREVNLIVFEDAKESRRALYEDALRVLARFNQLNIKIQVLLCRKIMWAPDMLMPSFPVLLPRFRGDVASEQSMSIREFVQEAVNYVPNIPDALRMDQYGNIDPGMITLVPPLVGGLLDSGELTLIVEHEGVPPFLMGHVIGQILKGTRRSDDFWPVRKGIRSMNLIPPEFQQRYQGTESKEFLLFSPVAEPTINDGRFLNLPEKDAVSMFQHAVQEKNIQVVSSPVPELFMNKAMEKINIFKELRSYCAKEGIGILIFLKSDGPLLEKLNSLAPNRVVHVYTQEEQQDSYVVETVPASGEKLPVFSFQVSGNTICSTRKEKEKILLSVKDRALSARKSQPGISADFMEKMKGK